MQMLRLDDFFVMECKSQMILKFVKNPTVHFLAWFITPVVQNSCFFFSRQGQRRMCHKYIHIQLYRPICFWGVSKQCRKVKLDFQPTCSYSELLFECSFLVQFMSHHLQCIRLTIWVCVWSFVRYLGQEAKGVCRFYLIFF